MHGDGGLDGGTMGMSSPLCLSCGFIGSAD